MREIVKEETNKEKELTEILKDADALHEDLHNYGSLKDVDKPLIVSGILLALGGIGNNWIGCAGWFGLVLGGGLGLWLVESVGFVRV